MSKLFGEPVSIQTKEISSKDVPNVPGLNWTLSEETIQKIKEIENNSKNAILMSQHFWVD